MMISRRRFLGKTAAAAAAGASIVGATANVRSEQDEPEPGAEASKSFQLHPVGRVELEGESPRIRILEPYVDALLGLDGWSHINVIYWFDRNDTPQRRGILRVHPRGNRDNPLTGVFACRAPVRPNLIALTACRLVSVEGAVVTVDRIDALDRTPVLDIKPLIPPDVAVRDLRVPEWTGRGRRVKEE